MDVIGCLSFWVLTTHYHHTGVPALVSSQGWRHSCCTASGPRAGLPWQTELLWGTKGDPGRNHRMNAGICAVSSLINVYIYNIPGMVEHWFNIWNEFSSTKVSTPCPIKKWPFWGQWNQFSDRATQQKLSHYASWYLISISPCLLLFTTFDDKAPNNNE